MFGEAGVGSENDRARRIKTKEKTTTGKTAKQTNEVIWYRITCSESDYFKSVRGVGVISARWVGERGRGWRRRFLKQPDKI